MGAKNLREKSYKKIVFLNEKKGKTKKPKFTNLWT